MGMISLTSEFYIMKQKNATLYEKGGSYFVTYFFIESMTNWAVCVRFSLAEVEMYL